MSSTMAAMANDLASVVQMFGETVLFMPMNGPSVSVRASVQSPLVDPLIGDALQEGFIVYVPPASLPQEPQQFDRLLIRGRERTIDAAHKIEADDRNLMWSLRVLG
jgi:hypothetical protein